VRERLTSGRTRLRRASVSLLRRMRIAAERDALKPPSPPRARAATPVHIRSRCRIMHRISNVAERRGSSSQRRSRPPPASASSAARRPQSYIGLRAAANRRGAFLHLGVKLALPRRPVGSGSSATAARCIPAKAVDGQRTNRIDRFFVILNNTSFAFSSSACPPCSGSPTGRQLLRHVACRSQIDSWRCASLALPRSAPRTSTVYHRSHCPGFGRTLAPPHRRRGRPGVKPM